MFGRKSRQLAEERERVGQLQEQLAEARKQATANLYAARRTAAHFNQLHERLEASRPVKEGVAAEAAYARTLEKRLDRALRAAGRYLAALWAARTTNARLRQLLKLADRPHRELAEQILQLQAANEAMCREAMGRVGMLAKPEAVSKR
ncbi:MAG: hypothetical protein ACRDQ0_00740 [Pseudonocardia sp.]